MSIPQANSTMNINHLTLALSASTSIIPQISTEIKNRHKNIRKSESDVTNKQDLQSPVHYPPSMQNYNYSCKNSCRNTQLGNSKRSK